jgi:hypothetical protein
MMFRLSIVDASGVLPYAFCPVCGTRNVSVYFGKDVSMNHWESLARDYGVPLDTIHILYRNWNPHIHHTFAEYVAAHAHKEGKL